MSANPPPLVSPVPGLTVRAVLDQDATLTAGLALDATGGRAVLLLAMEPCAPWEREEFLAWSKALQDAATVTRIGRIIDFGHTTDGRPFLASYVTTSLSDRLRLVGKPAPEEICGIGASIADALATAHSYGIVHAAVSPATILMVPDGVLLGGFGATAPGLTGPLNVWAFTAPEHRAAAADGAEVGTPAADVFALAATICVAFAGILPWSDPTSWADTAAIPDGPDAPIWATAVRAALAVDPDRRPSAEELATAMRRAAPAPISPFHRAKVDLRGLIPRAARRLAAASIDAMAEAMPVLGRASVPAPPSRFGQVQQAVSRFRTTLIVCSVIVLVGAALIVYKSAAGADKAPPARPSTAAAVPANKQALLAGAASTAETFLHQVAADDAGACADVISGTIITTPASPSPITCADLITQASALLSPAALTGMRDAQVGAAVDSSSTAATSENDISENVSSAFVSLANVPSLGQALNRLEIAMSFQNGRWFVVQVTLQ